MLVLSRKVGERIVIAGNVEIAIVQICGSRVPLGVTAPREVSVRRAELRTRIQEVPLHSEQHCLSPSP